MSGRYRYRRRSGWRSSYSRARRSYNRARSSLVKRAKGNARAANAQADTTDVVINLMHSTITMVQPFSFGVTTSNQTSEEIMKNTYPIGTAAINIFSLLAKSDFFNCYAPMYDQFRITSIKVKITPTKWATYDQQLAVNNAKVLGTDAQSAGTNNTDETNADITDLRVTVPGNNYQYPQSLTIVTAWDRTGLSESQFNTLEEFAKMGRKNVMHSSQEITEQWKASFVDSIRSDIDKSAGGINTELPIDVYWYGFFTNIGDKITTYSSAQTKQLVAGQSFNCTRYLYPQNQQEKSLYYSTNNLEVVFEKDPNAIIYTPTIEMVDVDHPTAFQLRDQLCSLNESPNIPFKPTLLIGVLGDSEVTAISSIDQTNNIRFANFQNKIRPIKFNLEFDIGVTFRGLRKTQVV